MNSHDWARLRKRMYLQTLSPLKYTIRLIMNTLKVLAVLYLSMVFGGALLFWLFEDGLSYWRSLYWAVVTVSTLGYGDISPKTVGGQIVCMIIVQLAIFVVVPTIVVHLLRSVIEDSNAFTHAEQEEIKAELDRLCAGQDMLDAKLNEIRLEQQRLARVTDETNALIAATARRSGVNVGLVRRRVRKQHPNHE